MNFNYTDFHGLRDPKNTRDLNTTEMSTYFEHCQKFALERWGITAFDEDAQPFDHGNNVRSSGEIGYPKKN